MGCNQKDPECGSVGWADSFPREWPQCLALVSLESRELTLLRNMCLVCSVELQMHQEPTTWCASTGPMKQGQYEKEWKFKTESLPCQDGIHTLLLWSMVVKILNSGQGEETVY
jgi:hypothetical protein